jgi:hypothetical protein
MLERSLTWRRTVAASQSATDEPQENQVRETETGEQELGREGLLERRIEQAKYNDSDEVDKKLDAACHVRSNV